MTEEQAKKFFSLLPDTPLDFHCILQLLIGNVKKCAVGKHPKSEKHGNTAQFSEVERSGTQENCGGGSGCRLRLHPLPVLHRRQSQRVARIDPNAVVVDTTRASPSAPTPTSHGRCSKRPQRKWAASWHRSDKSNRQAEHRKGDNFLSGALWLFPRISLYPWGMSWQ